MTDRTSRCGPRGAVVASEMSSDPAHDGAFDAPFRSRGRNLCRNGRSS